MRVHYKLNRCVRGVEALKAKRSLANCGPYLEDIGGVLVLCGRWGFVVGDDHVLMLEVLGLALGVDRWVSRAEIERRYWLTRPATAQSPPARASLRR